MRTLNQIIEWRGKPMGIRVENGPRNVSAALQTWAAKRGIEIFYIQPGKPQQSAYVERYNRTVRENGSARSPSMQSRMSRNTPPGGYGLKTTSASIWASAALPPL